MREISEPAQWYFLEGEIYIISDAPGAELRMKEHPELGALTLAELEQKKEALLREPPPKNARGA